MANTGSLILRQTSFSSQSGDNALYGQRGGDHINGGPGGDLLISGPHRDVLNGGRGFDRINARDVIIMCGNEYDTVYYDRGLDVLRYCSNTSSDSATAASAESAGDAANLST